MSPAACHGISLVFLVSLVVEEFTTNPAKVPEKTKLPKILRRLAFGCPRGTLFQRHELPDIGNDKSAARRALDTAPGYLVEFPSKQLSSNSIPSPAKNLRSTRNQSLKPSACCLPREEHPRALGRLIKAKQKATAIVAGRGRVWLIL